MTIASDGIAVGGALIGLLDAWHSYDTEDPASTQALSAAAAGFGSAGAVSEDCWNENYQGAPVDGSAWTTGTGRGFRVMRGGDFFNVPWVLRPASRSYHSDMRGNHLGFRVAKTLP